MNNNRAPGVPAQMFRSAIVCFFLLIPACAPEPEPVIDQATVVARHASVRMRNSSTSRTLDTLDVGDTVNILEQQDNWYRVQHGDRQGWMEESTIVTNATLARIRDLVAESQEQRPQNTAEVSDAANFRIEPGRSTAIIRQLQAGARLEVLDRVTLPRPNSDTALDAWLKVRPSPTEVGWVFASLVEFDVPPELAQYTEGRIYAAVKKINQVQDPIAGAINWYVIGERRPGLDPRLDFDGIRVFTWNLRRHRWETAYRIDGLRGVYPLEAGPDPDSPSFRIHELAPDNQTKQARDFVMTGVVVREVR